jgi:hypothetical protein
MSRHLHNLEIESRTGTDPWRVELFKNGCEGDIKQ